jgi:multimeric flavodoxin WrbA
MEGSVKKILGIVGSKRTLGNCEIVIKEISRNIDVPHELCLLRLPDFDLRPCCGCYVCLTKPGGCVLKDDLSVVLQAIMDADALILAVPTYFLGAHSCLKTFIDRGLSFYSVSESLWGKPAVGVGVSGVEGKEGSTLLDMERFFMVLQSQCKLNRVLYGALPGEALIGEENRKAVAELAAALFNPPPEKKGIRCPVCGGETFRFIGENAVRCMFCSNAGTITAQGETFVIDISKSDHDFMTSKKEALEHLTWLLEMKERFKLKKDHLKAITEGYKTEEIWIQPHCK